MKINLNSFCSNVVFIAVILLIISGCATTTHKAPIYLASSFHERQIDSIALMPIADIRKDRSFEIDVEKNIRVPVRKILEKKGYKVSTPDRFAEGKEPPADEISEMEIEELSELGPAASKVLLFVYLEDFLDGQGWKNPGFKIETSATLIDKENHLFLWRDKGIDYNVEGRQPFKPIETCIDNMLSSFPERPDKRK